MRVFSHFIRWTLGLAQAETQTTTAERAALARYARESKRLVEIGVWHGVTTRTLRSAVAPDAVLFAVDPYFAGRLGVNFQRIIARKEVASVAHAEVRWIRETGASAAAKFKAGKEPPVDFVFIDGDHSYDSLREDWEGWSDLVRPAGIVALHDSRSTPERDISSAGSVKFTREVILADSRFRVVEMVDSLTILGRLPASPWLGEAAVSQNSETAPT